MARYQRFGVVALGVLLGVLMLLDFAFSRAEPAVELPSKLVLKLGEVDLEMVLLNAKGNAVFQIGAPDGEKDAFDKERPRHKVTLTKPFYLGKFHVTRGQFAAFVKATNYKTEAETGDGAYGYNDKGEFGKYKDISWKKTGFTQTDEHPVVNVSWNDAKRFCGWLVADAGVQRQLKAKLGQRKLTFRLPSEAEWEYACRAGTRPPFHFGSVLNGKQANCDGNYPYGTDEKGPYLKGTTRVGTYDKNDFGLYDLHGNAWQWCEDCFDEKFYANRDIKDPLNIKNGENERVLRGGSWVYGARSCRAACRGYSAPDFRNYRSGFRACVRLD